MYNHLDIMIRSAEKNVTLLTTAEGLNRKFEALLPAFEKARRRGVSIKIGAPINAANVKVAKDMAKVAEVRDTSGKALNGRFAVIDSAQLMLMLLDDKTVHPNYDVAVWLSTPYLAQSMEQMFNSAWDSLTPLSKLKVK